MKPNVFFDHYTISESWADHMTVQLLDLHEHLVMCEDDEWFEPPSGMPFCGCEACYARETLVVIGNLFAIGVETGEIKVGVPWSANHAETLEKKSAKRNGAKKKVRRTWGFWKKLASSTNSAPVDASAPTTSNPIDHIFKVEDGPDYLWAGPTGICLCGSEMFHAIVGFDSETREVGSRILEMKCVGCGALVKGPTPIDGRGSFPNA